MILHFFFFGLIVNGSLLTSIWKESSSLTVENLTVEDSGQYRCSHRGMYHSAEEKWSATGVFVTDESGEFFGERTEKKKENNHSCSFQISNKFREREREVENESKVLLLTSMDLKSLTSGI